jgi:hypothetical protein
MGSNTSMVCNNIQSSQGSGNSVHTPSNLGYSMLNHQSYGQNACLSDVKPVQNFLIEDNKTGFNYSKNNLSSFKNFYGN